jgi:AraC-like DNA-binding protein
MSLIIHRVLFDKLRAHPEWRRFEDAFGTLAGRPVLLLEGVRVKRGACLVVRIDLHGVLVGVLVIEGLDPGTARGQACRHLLAMAAERFAGILAAGHPHDQGHLPAVVRRTCAWIRSHALTEQVRLAEAAQACGLSAGHLSRLFHHSTGLTFQEYVRRFRLEKACELLVSTDHSVTRIAFDAGFHSISQFHRSFKAVYGERPLEYRRKRC